MIKREDQQSETGSQELSGSTVPENYSGPAPKRESESLSDHRELSYGEKAVGLTFNPGGHEQVNSIKRLCADVIDYLNGEREEAKVENNSEKIAQYTLAIRDIQSGQMWAVKACTWQY